ncbi:MAG TPA: tRNA pseudouridine(38-40) synthase TruA [Bacteroidales bacterium]|nr:tRNA pseudouridine(38-40) synthase TruA [Bacteroidales bacterium]HNW67996.1 tRNA pseudouridine(38-40) synthase TruA [Bacteroidales bacterium]
MRYFIQLAYNGSPFFGWQIQPNLTTVQGVIENALHLLLREEISVTGCGRTDTGVHAKQFFAHFETEQNIDSQNLTDKLNNFLPKEIAIEQIFSVANDMHARFSAISRTYKYYISTSKDAFNFHFSFRIYQKLNIEKMNQAADLLLHTEDFTSFSKLHTQVNNNICHVSEARWQNENAQLVFTITADRFLRNMVRAIVGTLLEVGKGKLTPLEFQQIINQKDRGKAGTSVPAHALFLENVRYHI